MPDFLGGREPQFCTHISTARLGDYFHSLGELRKSDGLGHRDVLPQRSNTPLKKARGKPRLVFRAGFSVLEKPVFLVTETTNLLNIRQPH